MSRRPQGSSREPGVDEHLQLSAFKGKFEVTDFVGSVSEKLIAQSKDDAGPFDPKPFIRTFEGAIDKLLVVRKEIQAKTEQTEKSVRVSEREYSKKMTELNKGFEAVGASFSGVESRMNEVGSTAIRIGEQLETVHLERQRAQAAYDLIDFYNQFSRGDVSSLDTLRKEGRSGRRQVAVLLRRLTTVAKDVDIPSADTTRESIEKYCEKFEKEMLNLFDRSYRKGDPKMMHHCAQTLLEFNGGSSCVQVYVNQHDFFMNNVRETRPPKEDVLWDTIADPNESPPKDEIGLSELFTEIRSTVEDEAQIVKAVFPNPPMVLQVFLQRVFAQSIQQHMELLLHRSSSLSDLAYLRIMQLVHVQCSTLVEDLKVYELPIVVSKSSAEASEFRRALTGSVVPAPTSASANVSTMLESALEELFVAYTEGQRYLERENRSLSSLFASLLTAFTRYHEKVQRGKSSSVFDRVVNQLSAAAATTSAGGVSTPSAQAANALLRFGGLDRQDKGVDDTIREEDGLLSVDVAETMLKWHAEAVGRCVELSPINDVAKNTFSLLRVLSHAIGPSYMEEAIESAQVRLETSDSKIEHNLQQLSVLRSVDLICHLWQQYVNTALLPLASSSVTIRREMVVYNNQLVSRLEGGVNHLIHRVTDVIVAWLSQQLTKQKRNDFKPRDDDLSFARVNTEPCEACCDLLERVRDAAKPNLSGKNLEAFLMEIGVSFHSLLLEHLRKFPVNATGGLMLAKDIKMYQDTISSFGIPSLTERYEFIRQLGNIFLVQPEILKSYITENYLGRIDPSLLKPYLALRSDWGQFKKGFNDDDGAAEDGSPVDAKSLGNRFGRLSVMMKDLESIRTEGIRLGEGISIPSLPNSITGNFRLGG